jgi:putative RNA 2'-phosphotransferase
VDRVVTGDLTRLSRFLSYVLRHDPGAVGIELDAGGWVDVDTLLAALAEHGRPIGVDTLRALVAGTDKVRLQLRDGRVRAAQGHSVPVDLGLVPTSPPDVLYHGTVPRFLPGIRADGLLPGRRHHVHLSVDVPTAVTVGARRGAPVVLRVDAAGMHRAGHEFFLAANGVWLTAAVPPQWISEPG